MVCFILNAVTAGEAVVDYANFEKSTLRMSPEFANSVWKANAALRVAGVWPPLLRRR